MLYIAVCDDDEIILACISKEIQLAFQCYKQDITIDQYRSSEKLLFHITSGHHYDVLFLDVDMPSLSGIEMGKQLRAQADNCIIVFISSYERFVFDALQVSPFRYIRKSKFIEEVKEAVKALVHEFKFQDRLVTIHSQNSHLVLKPQNIIYVECNNKMLKIVLNDHSVFIRYQLSKLQQILIDFGFIRIHKGYLVNYRYISSVEGTDIVLESGSKLPVSKYRMKGVIDELGRLIS